MCGNYRCTKNALIALNVLYIIVSAILVITALYHKSSIVITSITLFNWILGCGIFLMVLSIVGISGAKSHNQVTLFFYMVILFILFLVQFSIACACLAIGDDQQMDIVDKGWSESTPEVQIEAQRFFHCCALHNATSSQLDVCSKGSYCCLNGSVNCGCEPCALKIKHALGNSLEIAGISGLFFAFTEFIGIWLTIKYRNSRNPFGDPSAFL
ncbi:Tetraspanin-31 [Halotydeus destructor]|nr:Tetraspanin-31 [Halotydeus destructor]